MNLLVIDLSVFPIFVGHVSGGELHMIKSCKRFIEEGFKITILTTPSGKQKLNSYNISAKLDIIKIPFEVNISKSVIGLLIIYFLRMIIAIPHIIKHSNYVAVFSFSNFLVDVLPAVIAKKNYASNLFGYVHHLEPSPVTRRKYHPLLPSIFSYLSDIFSLFFLRSYYDFIFANPKEIHTLMNMSFSRSKVGEMKHGLDTYSISQTVPSDITYDACFVGRLSPLKGIFDLIPIWKNVCKHNPNAKLAIIGSNEQENISMKMEKLIQENNLVKNIFLLGSVDHDEKYSILKSSKLFVFPSYEEGWGIAIYEAMACGIPVITYDLKAYRYSSKHMIKVPVGNINEFSLIISKLLNEKDFYLKSKNKMINMSQLDWREVLNTEITTIKSIINS